MSRLAWDGTAETVSRDQILRRERGRGNIHFPCSADHKQAWQPYPVDPYSCYMCDYTYIHIYQVYIISCMLRILASKNSTMIDMYVDNRSKTGDYTSSPPPLRN